VSNLLSQCERFLLSREAATSLIDAMARNVRTRWHGIARKAGTSEADCERIRGAFVYPGFSYT
jgi:serine/threonine-protein kinase HipA